MGVHPSDEPGASAKGFDDSVVAQRHRAARLERRAGLLAVRTPAAPAIFPGGVGWYRAHVALSELGLRDGQHVRLVFHGVYKNADVWVNGYHVGGRPSGLRAVLVRPHRDPVLRARRRSGRQRPGGPHRHLGLALVQRVGHHPARRDRGGRAGAGARARHRVHDAVGGCRGRRRSGSSRTSSTTRRSPATVRVRQELRSLTSGRVHEFATEIEVPAGGSAEAAITARPARAGALVRHRPPAAPPDDDPRVAERRRASAAPSPKRSSACAPSASTPTTASHQRRVAHPQGRVPARGRRPLRHRRARERLAPPTAQAQGDGLQRGADGAQPARARAVCAVRRARVLRHRRGVRRVGEPEEQVVAGAQRVPAAARGIRAGLPRVARARPRRHGRRPPQPPVDHRVEHRQRDRLPERPVRPPAVQRGRRQQRRGQAHGRAPLRPRPSRHPASDDDREATRRTSSARRIRPAR